MGERKFVWDEFLEGIVLSGGWKQEEDQKKNKGGLKKAQKGATVFCPHSYLVFNFQEALSTNQEIKFRKYFMRKIESKEDVVYLQDVKNLVLYLVTTRVSVQFIDFFHLPIADRFLRALIIYFQYYLETWEELLETRNATERKIENPLASGDTSKRSEDLKCLRLILAREYSNLLIGCEFGPRYHHMMAGETPLIQSQNEKDLRIFETLFALAHQVVWIALQRRHYNLIEIELQRLFRTEAYNTAERRNKNFSNKMRENDLLQLHGPKMRSRRKLLRNSSLPYQLLNSECDFRLLTLESLDSRDPRTIFSQNALLLEEEKFAEFGIKVGILGLPRSNFDHLLLPISEFEEKERDGFSSGKTSFEKSHQRIANFGPNLELDLKIRPQSKFLESKRYKKSRRDERKKWIDRAKNLYTKKQKETPSITITWEQI